MQRNKSSKFKPWSKPELKLQTTTLWDFPSQHYGKAIQGDKDYKGATPSYIIWNLLQRYTREGDVVLDPMSGSGTTIDVCTDLKRKGIGFDLVSSRPEIKESDARTIPLKDASVDFVFVDPPYGTHIDYSDHPDCIGKIDAGTLEYYEALTSVIQEIHRVLRNKRYFGLYVSDSFRKGKPFCPIGFDLFKVGHRYFKPIDIVCVTRHNRTLKRSHWHTAAVEGNYFLRGFNYLLIFKKELKG